MKEAYLILESGERFFGKAPVWQNTSFFGEVVFNTGMTGYVETLTDPSYAGQILVLTYPLIGNYGVPTKEKWESTRIHVRGIVLQSVCEHPDHYDNQLTFLNWLKQQNIPVLMSVDTRALTKILREKGVALGAIVCEEKCPTQFEKFDEQHWVKKVSIEKHQVYGNGNKKIIAVDCGMKENILRQLMTFPLTIKRVPYDYDYSNEDYDGIFLSNGPGDPERCQETVSILRKAMQSPNKKPIFGICLGTQLMALAIGAKTYKLRYGHRGQNQPCYDLRHKKGILTSQNHGYAIEEKSLPSDWEINFIHLNDQTVAGIQHKTLPWFSVQFHPEAAPGPHDSHYLFQEFYQSL